MAPVRAGFGFCGGRGGECDMVQDRQPARLVSASACAQEAKATCEQARGQRSGSVLPAVVVGRPGWRRSRRRGRQSYILREQEWHTGDATRHDGPTRSYAGVPTMFVQHTCVSRGDSGHEQKDPEVRGEDGIANQPGSIVLSQGSTTSSSSYPSLIAQPTTITTGPRHRRALLVADSIHRRNSLSACSSPQPKLPQGLP
jgi:hypothetical protein